jgi:hypothetical protein
MLLALVLVAACAPADAAVTGPTPASTVPPAPVVATPSAEPAASPAATPLPAPNVPSEAPGPSATPSPAVAASPAPADRGAPASSSRGARPYAISLASRADFVPQYTFEWCVGASIQMARSIITDDRNESRTSQRRLWEMARERTVGSPYGGANPAGWAAALTDLGLGRYRLVSVPSFEGALHRAARAIVETKRPVGLVMWAGRHAWVMTGFEASANPRRHPDARITRVRVMDPLHPHGSRWGPSPEPNSLIRPRALARQFVERNRPDYDFGVEPGWLLVLPVG